MRLSFENVLRLIFCLFSRRSLLLSRDMRQYDAVSLVQILLSSLIAYDILNHVSFLNLYFLSFPDAENINQNLSNLLIKQTGRSLWM
ncbi:protein of unknown function [Brevefilum fermentans]|uniref:Uncharacterized protein n=1 Tax=Candidatus Brevifilum fermentans TaxID=1986204 RepID=A0A1Y6K8X5_9CHLR|nr:protein of unknown function [Brevefilum fermentans]